MTARAEGSTGYTERRRRPDIGPFVAPRNRDEETLAEIVREILELDRVGMKDGFLVLGGDSLTATLLLLRIQDSFGIVLEPSLLFDSPDLAALSAAIGSSVDRASTDATLAPSIQARPDRIPLSGEQIGLFRMHQIMEDKARYNMTRAVRIRTRIDPVLLGDALTALLDRHEILRTRIEIVDGVPAQLVDSAVTADLEIVDLRDMSATPREAEGEARRHVDLFFRRPFDIETERLFRACLIRLADGDQVLALSVQHLATDGGSFPLMFSELGALYAALAAGRTLPARLALQYADYALWQKSVYAKLRDSQAAFWSPYLEGVSSTRWLAAPDTQAGLHELDARTFSLSPELTASLRTLGQREDVTLAMILFAANQIILARLCGTENILGGMTFSRRTRPEFMEIPGPIFMVFPVRTPVRPRDRFDQLLGCVKSGLLEVYGHLDTDSTTLKWSPWSNFNMLGDRDGPAKRLQEGLSTLDPSASAKDFFTPEAVGNRAPLEFSIVLDEHEDVVTGTVLCRRDVFDAAAIAGIARDFVTILERAADDPSRPLSEILPEN